MKKKILGLLLLSVSICSLASCSFLNPDVVDPKPDNKEEDKKEVTLEEITIEDKKYEYKLNGEIDTSNIKVIAHYSNGTTKDVSKDTTFAIDNTKAGEAIAYAIYNGMTTAFTVVIVEPVKKNIIIRFSDGGKKYFTTSDTFVTVDDLNVIVYDMDIHDFVTTPVSLVVYKNNKIVNSFQDAGEYKCEVTVIIEGFTYTASTNISVEASTSGDTENNPPVVSPTDNPGSDTPTTDTPTTDTPSGENTPTTGDDAPTTDTPSTDTPTGDDTPSSDTPSGGDTPTTDTPTGDDTPTPDDGGNDEPPVDDGTVPGVNKEELLEETVVNGNSFEMPVKSFVDKAPENTELAAFEVVDDDENQIGVYEYSSDLDSLYVNNLDIETNYTVYVYYKDKAAEQTVAMSYVKTYVNGVISESNGLEYPYKFVGVRVVTSNKVTRRVRFMYQNELLYTYYVGYGETLSPSYKFPLPNKYAEEYNLVGTVDNVTNITSDIVVEAILAKKVKATHTVIYTNRQGAYISVQEVATGSNATDPTYSDTYDKDNIRYTFKDFGGLGNCITEDKIIHPVYNQQEIEAKPNITLSSVYYENGTISVYFNSKGRVSGDKITLTDGSGNTYESDSYYANIKAPHGKTYTYKYDYTYTLSGTDFTDSLTGTITIPDLTKLNNAISFSSVTFNSFNITTRGINKVEVSNDKDYWREYNLSSGNGTYTMKHMYIGQTNYVRYSVKNSYGGYYQYDEILEVTTPAHAEPTISYTRTPGTNKQSFTITGTDIAYMASSAYCYWDVPELNSSYYSTYASSISGSGNSVSFTIEAPKAGSSYYASTFKSATFYIKYNTYSYGFDLTETSGTLSIEKEYYVDEYNSKTVYVNEQYNINDVKCTYGWVGERVDVNPSDLSYKLYYDDNEVSSFTKIGYYKVVLLKDSIIVDNYEVLYVTKEGMVVPKASSIYPYDTFVNVDNYVLTGSQNQDMASYDVGYKPTKAVLYDASGTKLGECNSYGAGVSFINLTPSTSYYLEVYYEKLTDSTDTYTAPKVKFTTSDESNYYLVQYKYNGNVIASQVQSKNNTISTSVGSNYYVKQALTSINTNYQAAGIMSTDLKVTSNKVVDIVVYDSTDLTNIPVLYMNGNGTVYKVEICHTVGKVIRPNVVIPEQTFDSIKYTFGSWKEETYTITDITRIYPNYTTE